MRRFAFIAFVLGVSSGSTAQTADLLSVTYVCERGVEVPVVFVNAQDGESIAVAGIDGKLIGMRVVISASGARYRSGDGDNAYQLWTKGDTASIFFGPDGRDTILFQDCTARP